MLLRLSKRSSFPIRHLFYFANCFVEHLKAGFCKTDLLVWVNDVQFAVERLDVNKILDIVHEFQVRELFLELV